MIKNENHKIEKELKVLANRKKKQEVEAQQRQSRLAASREREAKRMEECERDKETAVG